MTRRRAGLLLVSLSPVWVFLWFALTSSQFAGAWLTNQVNFAGAPLGIVLLLVAGALTLLGAMGMWSWRRAGIALVLFTFPAVLLVIIGPALITIVINLGTSS